LRPVIKVQVGSSSAFPLSPFELVQKIGKNIKNKKLAYKND